MTPKEKAEQLVDLYYPLFTNSMAMLDAKQCALIAVDEILEMDLPIFEEDSDEFYDYWQEVKQEIEKL